MTTYRHYSTTTVHVLRDGTRIGSLYRGGSGAWYFEHHQKQIVSDAELVAAATACDVLYGKESTPERVEALNRKL